MQKKISLFGLSLSDSNSICSDVLAVLLPRWCWQPHQTKSSVSGLVNCCLRGVADHLASRYPLLLTSEYPLLSVNCQSTWHVMSPFNFRCPVSSMFSSSATLTVWSNCGVCWHRPVRFVNWHWVALIDPYERLQQVSTVAFSSRREPCRPRKWNEAGGQPVGPGHLSDSDSDSDLDLFIYTGLQKKCCVLIRLHSCSS